MTAVERLALKLSSRIYVPGYVRVNEDNEVEHVDGYWRDVPDGTPGAIEINDEDGYPVAHPLRKYPITYFDSRTCGRCGGTGEFSYNPMHGTVCFGCEGRGRKLTEEGSQGYGIWSGARKKEKEPLASEVEVGDVIAVGDKENPGKRIWATVDAIHDDGTFEMTKGGEPYSTETFTPNSILQRKPRKENVPDPSTLPGYVGFSPEGWRIKGLPSEGMPVDPEVRRLETASPIPDGRNYSVEVHDYRGHVGTIGPFDNERAAVEKWIEKRHEGGESQYRVSVSGTSFETQQKWADEAAAREAAEAAASTEARTFIENRGKSARVKIDFLGSEFEGTIEDFNDEKILFKSDQTGNTVNIPWEQVKGAKLPDEEAQQESILEKAATTDISPEELNSNMAPAYLRLKKKGKLTNDEMNEQMVDAAMQALNLFGESASAGRSEFVQSVYDQMLKKGSISPAQARGVLNYLKKDIIKFLEKQASFTEMISKL